MSESAVKVGVFDRLFNYDNFLFSCIHLNRNIVKHHQIYIFFNTMTVLESKVSLKSNS